MGAARRAVRGGRAGRRAGAAGPASIARCATPGAVAARGCGVGHAGDSRRGRLAPSAGVTEVRARGHGGRRSGRGWHGRVGLRSHGQWAGAERIAGPRGARRCSTTAILFWRFGCASSGVRLVSCQAREVVCMLCGRPPVLTTARSHGGVGEASLLACIQALGER